MLLNLLGDSDLNLISSSSGNRRHIIPFPTSYLQRHCSPGSTQARSVPCQAYHLGGNLFYLSISLSSYVQVSLLVDTELRIAHLKAEYLAQCKRGTPLLSPGFLSSLSSPPCPVPHSPLASYPPSPFIPSGALLCSLSYENYILGRRVSGTVVSPASLPYLQWIACYISNSRMQFCLLS